MKLGEYGLGEYGFCILSVTMQVQTVERALTIGSIKLSVVRFICVGGIFCVFFSLSIKHVQYTQFSVKMGKLPSNDPKSPKDFCCYTVSF